MRTWYFEVWNEPNLSGFWEGGDQKAYFELYDLTAQDDQNRSTQLRVGGPVPPAQHGFPNSWRMLSSAALRSIS